MNMRYLISSLAMILVCLQLPAQQAAASKDPIDRFLGTWELHMKEGQGIPERESLTFERTEAGIKITHFVFYNSDSTLHYWGVMDPKGSFVRMQQMNGKPMNEEWRIISVNANALLLETRPFGGKNQYILSADGRTMKIHKLTAAIAMYPPPPEEIFQKAN